MNAVKKAVILARGLGTRMRAESETDKLDAQQTEIAAQGLKTLIPIFEDKTLLDFILENLVNAGIEKICLVIGAEHSAIREFCQKKPFDISFAIQEKPLGTANAVLAAEKFAGNDLFLSVNSDNLYPVNDLRRLCELNAPSLIGYESAGLIEKSNIPAERIAKFAVLEIDENEFLEKITEKPENVTKNSLVSMNAWIFSPKIFSACQTIKPSPRGEFELADAVMFAIENLGEKFTVVKSNEGVLDLSNRADIQRVAEFLKNTGQNRLR